MTDPLGHTTSFDYDAADRRTETADAEGDVTLTGYDPSGNLISSTDPYQHTSTYTYDAADRLVRASSRGSRGFRGPISV